MCSTSKPDTENKLCLQRSVNEPRCLFSTEQAVSPTSPASSRLRQPILNSNPEGKGLVRSRPPPLRAPPHHGGRAPHAGRASRSLPQQRPAGPGRSSANQRRVCCGAGGSSRWRREAARRGRGGCGPGPDPGWGSAGREGAAGEPLLAREPSAWRVARERQLPLS